MKQLTLLALILITVFANAQNLKPIPKPDTLRCNPGGQYATNLLVNDVDPNGDPIKMINIKMGGSSYSLTTSSPSKTLTIPNVGTVIATLQGSLTFKPLSTYSGIYSNLSYTPSDGKAGTNIIGRIVLIAKNNLPDTTLLRSAAYYAPVLLPCTNVKGQYRSMLVMGNGFYCGLLQGDTTNGMYYYMGSDFWVGDPRYPEYFAIKQPGQFGIKLTREDYLFLKQYSCN